MARKIEDWTGDPLREPRKLAEALMKLGERDIAIIGGAFLDSLLADLVSLGLRDDPKEVEDFVGLDADGRAPAGSFGARIQLAYLLELIDLPTMRSLRLIKDIRNLFRITSPSRSPMNGLFRRSARFARLPSTICRERKIGRESIRRHRSFSPRPSS
jgi:hypothetical protein